VRGQELLAAGVALALSACSSQHGAPTPGVPPFRAGSVFVCSGLYPYPAYENGHLFYPPGRPATPPPLARPARCFATAVQARSAGYRQAPIPPGIVTVGPIYLMPTGPSLVVRCRDAARRTGLTIPCPGLLPGSAALADFYPQRGSFVMTLNFGGPPGSRGIPNGPSNHIFVFALRPRYLGTFGGCPSRRVMGHASVRGDPGVLLACASGSEDMNAGHVVFRWTHGGAVDEVSVHNPTTVNRRIVEDVAASVRYIAPPHR
jgi:hypothetical protein